MQIAHLRPTCQLVGSAVSEVRLEFAGELVNLDAAPVTRSFLAGLLRDVSARVNVVNAFVIAEERRITVTTSYVRGGHSAPAIRTRVMSVGGGVVTWARKPHG